jgi:poly(3-hydroxybutyrate) depolymerase
MKTRLLCSEMLLAGLLPVSVFAAAPQITPSTSFQQSAVNLDQTNVFAVSATGDAPLSYQWRFENTDLPNETNRSLTIRNAQPAHEGYYAVVITNAFGAITSSPTPLHVVPRQTDFIKDNFTNSARQRLPYFYLLPAGYDPARKYPLYCWFHGRPGDETGITAPGDGFPAYGSFAALKALASFGQQATDPVIFVWPARRAGDAYVGWTDDYLRLVLEFLDRLLVRFSIDTNRIYVAGGSEGMHAAWDLLAMRPGFFAGAHMAAGYAGSYSAAAIKNTPMWICCASDDTIVTADRTRAAVTALRNVGGNPIFTEYRTGEHMGAIGIPMMTPVVNEWLLSQRRGQDSTNQPLLTVTNRDQSGVWRTANTSLALAGLANALGETVTNVWWTNYAKSAKGPATGSNTWAITAVPLLLNRTNIITVVGTTTSWASAYGGNTTFNTAVRVACYSITATLAWRGTNAVLNWTGGGPPYSVQRATDLVVGDWQTYVAEATPPLDLPPDGGTAFYRIGGK